MDELRRERERKGDRSDESRIGDTLSRRGINQDVLVGELVEAVRGLKTAVREQKAAVESLAHEVVYFKQLAQNARWLVVGWGFASMGMGAAGTRILEFFWPS